MKKHQDITYMEGEVHYCNWPLWVSRDGNYKIFLETKWDHPFEQTWMSYVFQKIKKDEIKPAVLLLSPIKHDRFDHYTAEERREN
jgi:predicted alpha/beta hydrolase family esterase